MCKTALYSKHLKFQEVSLQKHRDKKIGKKILGFLEEKSDGTMTNGGNNKCSGICEVEGYRILINVFTAVNCLSSPSLVFTYKVHLSKNHCFVGYE